MISLSAVPLRGLWIRGMVLPSRARLSHPAGELRGDDLTPHGAGDVAGLRQVSKTLVG